MTESAPVYVPISIEALVVNEHIRKTQKFRRFQMAYSALEEGLSPEALPFGGGEEDFDQFVRNEGVYLQWTLPEALRKSRQDEDGDDVFPLVPNRWLVVRLSGPLAERQADAWVVESDYLDANKGTSPYLHPRSSKRTMIGRKVPLSGSEPWKESGAGEPFLTAVGAGDLTFTAYQPNVENVFSLHDPLSEAGIDEGTLSYFVAGWYSERDILSGWETTTEYLELLEELGWPVADDACGQGKRSLYHGMVYGVQWDRYGQNLRSARDGASPDVAVGSTSTEAMGALMKRIADRDEQSARMLQVLQYQMLSKLDDPDAGEAMGQDVHQSAFGSSPGGTVWRVMDHPDVPKPDPPLSAEQKLAQQKKEERLLAPLNRAQKELDEERRILQSLQRRLYEMWWKQRRAFSIKQATGRMPDGTDEERFDEALQKLKDRIETKQDWVANQAEKVKDLSRNDRLDPYRRFVSEGMPRFWFAQDPVVLLPGLSFEPEKEDLYIRYLWQGVKGVSFTDSGATTEISIDQLLAAVPTLDLTHVPARVRDLYLEFFLLDPYQATTIAQHTFPGADDALIERLFQAMKERKSYRGVLPALGVKEWKQPWQPLYLEWQVNWHPLPFLTDGQPNWRFDGTDYVCQSTDERSEQIQVINGRTLLTPKVTDTFRARLEQILKEHALEDPLKGLLQDFLVKTQEWKLMSQVLSGFHHQLALRDIGTHLLPDDDTSDLIGGNQHLAPIPGRAHKPPFVEPSPSAFQPTRNGQFCFQRLLIVDRFGQTLEVIEDHDQFCPSLEPIVADEMTPDLACEVPGPGANRFVQLRPRVLQGSRLHFHFVSPQDEKELLNLEPEVHPVIGWVLPNHLERGMFVYDREGNCLGTLLVTKQKAGECQVSWWPPPGSPYQELEDLKGDNRHLYDFLFGLKSAGEEEFMNFLKSVDSTLWMIDPLGEREDRNLSVIVGRPMPLVRAMLQFELEGPPLEDPSWPVTFKRQHNEIREYPFSIRLGQFDLLRDGLLGYYVGKDYSRFNAVYNYVSSNYVTPIKPGNFLELKMSEDEEGSQVYVTMLMMPYAKVHAQTGILPVRTVELPKRFVEPVLANLQVHFHTGPLLTHFAKVGEKDGQPVKAARMPVPNVQKGVWSWVERGPAKSYADYPILQAGEKDAPTTQPPSLREGLLRLTGGLSG